MNQNADNTRQTNQLTASACEMLINGGSMMLQIVDATKIIKASSKKIVGIVSVINGIAFQSNILASNATVEATRAGQQGRGFAVVVTEVCNLTQHSPSTQPVRPRKSRPSLGTL